ncbi:hypothetical protein D3C84_1143600 [compost metagenome]
MVAEMSKFWPDAAYSNYRESCMMARVNSAFIYGGQFKLPGIRDLKGYTLLADFYCEFAK